MIKEDKQKRALKAIHDLIIFAKIAAGNNMQGKQMFDLLDDVEYFPALLLEEEDRTDLFENYLKETCDRYNCSHIYLLYNK